MHGETRPPPGDRSRPGRVKCLALRKQGRTALLPVNRTSEPQRVTLDGNAPRPIASELHGGTGELTLRPYAVVRPALVEKKGRQWTGSGVDP